MEPSTADERALEAEGRAMNRILTIGRPGHALIERHVDTGEQVGGNPVWQFWLRVTPRGGAEYAVCHRQIVSAAAVASYPPGIALACRIDPEDPLRIAFGDRPFL